jgi:hypothetical protein
LKSKQCPLSLTHPVEQSIEQRKRKNEDYNKNASENTKRLSKAKNASDQLGGAADPPFGVFSCR